MPSGNLTVVNNSNGKVVATGCKTVKQVESVIYDYLSGVATEANEDTVNASFSVMSPYKKFGDSGTKGYSVPRTDLIIRKNEQSSEGKDGTFPLENLEDSITLTDEEGGLDIV